MRMRLSLLADPMIAMLLFATGLALLAPVVGDGRSIAQAATNVAIFVLFLVNGLRVPRREIFRGLGNWRFLLPLTLFVFGFMGFAGLGLATLASDYMPPMIALGFLFLGILPSTIQSATSYSTLAGGNVALSVIAAALINIVGVFLSAPLFAFLGGGEAIASDYGVVAKVALILVLPFAIGQAIQTRAEIWVQQHRARIAWLDRAVIALAVYVAMSGAVEQGLFTKVDSASWMWLAGLVAIFLAAANAAAWLCGRALGLALQDRIAFVFAASQKSVAVGAPLAAILFPPATGGFVMAPLLLYHLLQLVLAAPLASWLASLRRS